jgi:phage tail sheath protein FI
MPAPYRYPGVYVEEIATLPPSVAEVATAVPAFVGYTEGPADRGAGPVVVRIATMLEYETAFGGPQAAKFTVTQPLDDKDAPAGAAGVSLDDQGKPRYALYYALQHYFRNGGGPCYVVSVGTYAPNADKEAFRAGIDALEKEDEPTLIVLTDAACVLAAAAYYEMCGWALKQCKKLGDRFTILDVMQGDTAGFRNSPSLASNLMYGAAYHPYLLTSIAYEYNEADVTVKGSKLLLNLGGTNGANISFGGPAASAPGVVVDYGAKKGDVTFEVSGATLTIVDANGASGAEVAEAWGKWKGAKGGFAIAKAGTGASMIASEDMKRTAVASTTGPGEPLSALKDRQTALYNAAKAALAEQCIVLPPSAAMAGIYARVDREQGVWKAPANVGVASVLGAVTKITNEQQEDLNIDPTAGKSINAIRDFTGKGTLVWGSRTLAGNDNEWRYVPVRRLFITIEESAKKASAFAVFEPNDQGTWLKVKAMIESYLYGLWEQGALAGSKPEQAYYVHVGLGTTMTPQDVLEGRMIVEIGIAAVRPAEFIVLRFSHKLQTA